MIHGNVLLFHPLRPFPLTSVLMVNWYKDR
jgi:hypothetical protein